MNSNTFQPLNGKGFRFAVIAARFNAELTDAMLADCVAALRACGVTSQDVATYRVPGSFELPVAAKVCVDMGRFDAVICLGVIIKGETTHDQYIANSVANALNEIAVQEKTPVVFGVLTTNDRAQAEARALGGEKKGYEAGMSAVEMAILTREMKGVV